MSVARSLNRLIRPKSIAVFGGREARRVIEQCGKMGFTGEIWPVHPHLENVLGHRCYRSVAELPAAPDAAFVGVNRHLTIDIVRDLAAHGAGGAICYASGFREATDLLADGEALQDALVSAAADMPVVGPNCYGFINALDGAPLWPDQHGMQRVEKGVAILTQSSNIACNISMQRRGLPLAYVITVGNQAQTGLSELAIAALEDPRVTAVGLHIEGFDSIEALQRLATRARDLKKPVVTLKVGKSEAAKLATISHTASLAGNDAVSSALLKRLGIGRVDTLPELLETLKLLHLHPPLKTFDISAMSCSGGEASLIADAGIKRKTVFRVLKEEQRQPLRDILGDMVTITNPLDYHTFVWGNLEKQTTAFSTMMKGEYALNLVILDFPRLDRCDATDWNTTCNAVIAAAQATGAIAAIVASLGENMPEETALSLMASGIVAFCGIDEALAAAEISAQIGATWKNPAPEPLLVAPPEDGEIIILGENEAKAELARFGVVVPAGKVAMTAGEAAEIAEKLGFPVVLKGLGVAHKTEAGAVKLNLADRQSVLDAVEEMAGVASAYIVEKMIAAPVAEIIVGALRDPVAGLVLTIGAGGILVELLNDSVILTLPTTPNAIREAISSLRINTLLNGYRGSPPGDIEALAAAVAAVASYVASNAAKLEELDINPIMVLPRGLGTVAVDALIRRRK